jgi:hypothetical protein
MERLSVERQTLSQCVDSLSPEDALEQMAVEIRKLFSHFPEDERTKFLVGLMRDEDPNEESSLVHL